MSQLVAVVHWTDENNQWCSQAYGTWDVLSNGAHLKSIDEFGQRWKAAHPGIEPLSVTLYQITPYDDRLDDSGVCTEGLATSTVQDITLRCSLDEGHSGDHRATNGAQWSHSDDEPLEHDIHDEPIYGYWGPDYEGDYR